MLRRNRETGKMERMIDGAWVPVDNLKEEAAAWTDIENLFNEIDAGMGVKDAAGPSAEVSDAGRDLAVPVDSGSAGNRALVEVAEGAGSDGRGVSDLDDNGVVDEIPGLTTNDGRSGTRGSRSTLQRLRERAQKKTPNAHSGTKVEKPVQSEVRGNDTKSQPVSVRAAQRIEVSENAAKPRGPAVRDTTERRQAARASGKAKVFGGGADAARKAAQDDFGPRRQLAKPAPGILSGKPKWMLDLFEAHFRSSRTRELRHVPTGPAREVDGKFVTPNRMKMSREDFAIGWLVMLEAAQRDPHILHTRAINGYAAVAPDASREGRPVLPAPSNT